MTDHKPEKTELIEVLVSPDELAPIQRAAELHGRSVAEFMMAAALAEARRIIGAG